MHISSSVFCDSPQWLNYERLEAEFVVRGHPATSTASYFRPAAPKNCDTKTKLGLKLWHLCMIIKQIMLNLQSWLISAVVTKNPATASTMMASSSLQQSARVSLLSRQGGEVWRKVTMVAKFRDHNNRELKQRIGRRQRERQKSKWFISAKQTLCTCITPFCTFLSRRCTTATWNFLISCARSVEWVNTTVKIFLFVFLT